MRAEARVLINLKKSKESRTVAMTRIEEIVKALKKAAANALREKKILEAAQKGGRRRNKRHMRTRRR